MPPVASQKEALAWLQAERANLLAAADQATAIGLAVHAVWLPAQLGDFLRYHGYLDQALVLHQAAAEIAEDAGDRAGQATALRSLGYIRRLLGQHSAAITSLTRALGLYRDLGDQPGQMDVLDVLARAQTNIDDLQAATASATEALTIARATGDKFGEGNALGTLAVLQGGTWRLPGGCRIVQRSFGPVPFCRLPARPGTGTDNAWVPADSDGRLRAGWQLAHRGDRLVP
jgi:tetratricopeptide (TPR) repeat protein